MNTYNAKHFTISVITPIFNGAKYIQECMKSVLIAAEDEGERIEHIIVDDGSTDSSLNLVGEFINEYCPRHVNYNAKFISITHSGKPSIARNAGIREAQGKYIFCIDHDDVVLSNTLALLFHYIEKTKAQVIYGDFLRVDEFLRYIVGSDYRGRHFSNLHQMLIFMFLKGHYFQHSFLFAKDLWQRVGGYDEAITFGEDFDLCLRFGFAGFVPEYAGVTTHLHRDHDENLTGLYVDPLICPLRKAEHRSHVSKHIFSLEQVLSPSEILKVLELLDMRSRSFDYSPPTRTGTPIANP